MRRLAGAAFAAALMLAVPARAQMNIYPPIDAPTVNGSVKITTGLTFQQVLGAITPTTANPNPRRSLTIQNNNASDSCNVIVGTNQITAGTTTTSTSITINGNTLTAAQASIVLTAGQSYTRYYPFVPSDIIFATCATTGDSLYVDTQ